ncbi:MAG: ABC transporter permease [Acidobacteriota bacterium]
MPRAGAPFSVILTHGYWQGRLGGSPDVIGRVMTIESQPHRVIGVMPQDFRFLNAEPELILPLQFDPAKLSLGDFSYQGIARLKPGMTLEQANADVARMLPLWFDRWPAPPGLSKDVFKAARFGPKVQPLKTEVIGNVGDSLWVLMGTIATVLLIACANVANLLLVRAEGRQQEIAIRAALGAGWGTIAREMLAESLMLGFAGGALGLGLAYAALRVFVASGPTSLPRLHEIGVDGAGLLFTLAASLASAVLFGMVPVWKYASPKVANALRAGGRTLGQSRERYRARGILVVTQVALALVLLVGCGLMIRTFEALRGVDPGFSTPQQIQIARISLPEALVPEPARVEQIEEAMREKLAAIPGVTHVAFSSSVPLERSNSNDIIEFEDKPTPPGGIPAIRRMRSITPGYFAAMGTPIMAGRDVTWRDVRDRREVVMISRNLAVEIFGSPQAAIGKRLRESRADPWSEIAGVAGDVHDTGSFDPAPTTVYSLSFQHRSPRDSALRNAVFTIRSSRAGSESLLKEMRSAIWAVQPDLPIFRPRTMQVLYDESMARTSFTLVMLAIAGGLALVLGVVGIYGVIAYTVTQRTREIGIRLALGAEPSGLKGLFVRQGMTLAAIGVAIGLAGAAALSGLMKSLLFGVTPLDPWTFASVPAVLALAVAAASYWPARRASKVDPMAALRAD